MTNRAKHSLLGIILLCLLLLPGCGDVTSRPSRSDGSGDSVVDEANMVVEGIEISNENWHFSAERIEGVDLRLARNTEFVLHSGDGREARIKAREARGVLSGEPELKDILFSLDPLTVTADSARVGLNLDPATIEMVKPHITFNVQEGVSLK